MLLSLILVISFFGGIVHGQTYSWRAASQGDSESIFSAIPPPTGFGRISADDTSFTYWLRRLPLKKAGAPVMLHNGRRKAGQSGHVRVIEIDVGTANLQQCTDAVIRLRAEYLYSRGKYDDIRFNFTNGDTCAFVKWSQGYRPVVNGNRVSWDKSARPNSSYASFRAYMNTVFMYAGSYSLKQELQQVKSPDSLAAGDIFIQGGFPGHAIIVVDVAVDSAGRKAFLLAQSYMPAQDIHILKNPKDRELSPWYIVDSTARLVTPDWSFDWSDLMRFRR
jgi:hypothetical protein